MLARDKETVVASSGSVGVLLDAVHRLLLLGAVSCFLGRRGRARTAGWKKWARSPSAPPRFLGPFQQVKILYSLALNCVPTAWAFSESCSRILYILTRKQVPQSSVGLPLGMRSKKKPVPETSLGEGDIRKRQSARLKGPTLSHVLGNCKPK